jgi:hypothetical protein
MSHRQARKEPASREAEAGQASPQAQAGGAARAHEEDPGGHSYANFTVELLLEPVDAVGNRFTVVGTRVVHMQSLHTATWSGLAAPRLLDFLAESASLVPGDAARPAPEPEEPQGASAEPPATVEALVGTLILEEIGGSFPRRMRARVPLWLSPRAAELLATRRLPYVLQILACELSSAESAVLVSGRPAIVAEDAGEPCAPGQWLPFVATAEFPLPGPGRYQLQSTLVLPTQGIAASGLGPVVNVVTAG